MNSWETSCQLSSNKKYRTNMKSHELKWNILKNIIESPTPARSQHMLEQRPVSWWSQQDHVESEERCEDQSTVAASGMSLRHSVRASLRQSVRPSVNLEFLKIVDVGNLDSGFGFGGCGASNNLGKQNCKLVSYPGSSRLAHG